MTGRELILYILANNLENENVFENGKFIGFLTVGEAAEKFNVGIATIRHWIEFGYLDSIHIYENFYIPCNAELKKGGLDEKKNTSSAVARDTNNYDDLHRNRAKTNYSANRKY